MEIARKDIAVRGIVQVQDHALVFRGEGCRGEKCLLPGVVAVDTFRELFDLGFEHILCQGVNVGIIIVKGVARDLAPLGDVAHGNFIKGTFGQQLDKAAADRVLGAKRHVGSPLNFNFFLEFIILYLMRTQLARKETMIS